MVKTIEFDISDNLRNKGISRIVKDGYTILVEYNDIPIRSTIYNEDITKTTNNLEKQCNKLIDDQLCVQNIIYIVSKNWNQFIETEISNKLIDKNNQVLQSMQKINISYNEWQNILLKKYTNLQKTVQETFPELSQPLEFALSIKLILNISDITLPFAGIILGPPSSLKTLAVEVFRNLDNIFFSDKFSAKSFVSHNSSVSKKDLKEIDLLPKIKNKCFLTPELAPLFATREEDLKETLGIITRILDGHGYESDTGAQGHRGYNEDIMFTWIGVAVEIPRKVHKLLGTLGPKLFFYRISNNKRKDDDDYLEQLKNSSEFNKKKRRIEETLVDYVSWFEQCPKFILDENSGLNKIEWTYDDNDEDEALKIIIKLSKLLSKFRGVVPTWETSNTQGSDYAFETPIIEEPDRAMTQLYNLARGHALTQGRTYITLYDIPLIIKVVLSTAPRDRVILFDKLLENDILDSVKIRDSLYISKPTVLRTMTEFVALGLANDINLDSEDNSVRQIQLKGEFEWFQSEEFKKLRNNFGKEYYQQYVEEKTQKNSSSNLTLEQPEERKEKVHPRCNTFLENKNTPPIFSNDE